MFDLLGSKDEERTQSWKHYHYGSSDILKVIGRRRLLWAGHAWRNQNPLLHAMIEQNPVGKKKN